METFRSGLTEDCYELQTWIFGQTPWADADQNLTIRTPLLSDQTTKSVWEWHCRPAATHEALQPHCCCRHRQHEQGGLSGQSTKTTEA